MEIKKIIVTGGSGFLGHHLLRALDKAGYQAKNIDLRENKEFETVIADVRDTEKMLEEVKDADMVFHLASLIEAGESVEKPQKYIDYNIDGTLSVLEAMKANGIKTFIFSSSAAVYGEPIRVPIKEDDRTMPVNPYGMTKLAMEALLSSYVGAHGFTGIALRYFNLYGPGEHHEPETHAMPRFIKQIYDDKEVTVWGSGEHKRDYVHVTDIVDAHLKAIKLAEREPEKYHYMNLSAEDPASVLDIVSAVEKAMNKKANVKHFDPRPGDPLLLYADATKAKETLSWEAKISLEDGIKEVVDYFTEYWEKN
ncbi:MAG: NAD-dependent epimerase/dehydratase family protein [Candidatus Pacebacteria bacterium]|nr:NAD-dependent epimerase/dehydratase family protein [Candidatus Paceibacterota bacterium]